MEKQTKFFRNSDLRINRYFARPEFKERLLQASKHGKATFYNEVRILNNCYYARKLQGDISIKDIFSIYWDSFKKVYAHRLTRPHLVDSIESMLSCHNFDKGYLFYECPSCNNFYMMGFSCHSRFCTSCGQKYKKQRSVNISEKLLSIPHRQFVFTIPEQLRKYFQIYRRPLLNILFSSVNDALVSFLKRSAPLAFKRENRKLGFISFLHTFGRDLKWHPHLHVLLAERYLTRDGTFKKFDFFSFDFLRITFRNILLHHIYLFFKSLKNKKLLQKFHHLSQQLKADYPKGFYIYGPKFDAYSTTTRNIKSLSNYIIRYASHPPISERRILRLDSSSHSISWFYDPHEDDDIHDEDVKLGRQFITEDVFSFMAKLIVHIPDKGFQTIRYYGFYSNKFSFPFTNFLFSNAELSKMLHNTFWINGLLSSFGYDPTLCSCGSHMIINFELSLFKGGP